MQSASKARDLWHRIEQSGVVAIVRAKSARQLLAVAEAVRAGGLNAIEVSLTTPGALEAIRQLVDQRWPDLFVGAGTVLDPHSAYAAISAGAQFIICPTLDPRTIEVCHLHSTPVVPGAYTPTEILNAWRAGADTVKVFPAEAGGPAYIRAIKAPLPHVSLMAVGGVDLSNAADFIRAGADMIGVGSALISHDLLDREEFETIARLAARFKEEVLNGRSGPDR